MNRKVVIIIFLCCFFSFGLNVYATGGALRKNTIKTCSNGITYGLHSDGKGGTHWHKAITNGENYYPDGSALSADPCPNSKVNKGTAGKTSTKRVTKSGVSKETSKKKSDKQSIRKSKTSKNSIKKSESKKVNATLAKKVVDSKGVTNDSNKQKAKVQESSDATLKSVVINGDDIVVSEKMSYSTFAAKVNVSAIANDSKASIKMSNADLNIGNNLLLINVVAPDGTKKEYGINVFKKRNFIEEFVIDSSKLIFRNNEATYSVLKGESSFKYSYKLSDKSADLVVFHNGVIVDKIEDLKDNDVLKLIVMCDDVVENTYEVKIKELSLLGTIFVYGLTIGLLLSPIALVIYLCLRIRKKKKIKNS